MELLFLSKEDVDSLQLGLQDIIDVIEAGLKPGRTSQRERILFWHKGFAVSDVVLGHLIYQRAREMSVGTPLELYRDPQDM